MKSKANSKLKNIDTIQRILDGTHRTQTRTINANPETTESDHKIGETWVENGITYIQKDGYVVKEGKLKYLRENLYKPKNCLKDICTCTKPTRLDIKMIKIHGMCMDCVAVTETKLRVSGEFDAYEKTIQRNNAIGWLKEAKKDASIIAQFMAGDNIALEDGTSEKWQGRTADEIKNDILEQFEEFEKKIMEAYN